DFADPLELAGALMPSERPAAISSAPGLSRASPPIAAQPTSRPRASLDRGTNFLTSARQTVRPSPRPALHQPASSPESPATACSLLLSSSYKSRAKRAPPVNHLGVHRPLPCASPPAPARYFPFPLNSRTCPATASSSPRAA